MDILSLNSNVMIQSLLRNLVDSKNTKTLARVLHIWLHHKFSPPGKVKFMGFIWILNFPRISQDCPLPSATPDHRTFGAHHISLFLYLLYLIRQPTLGISYFILLYHFSYTYSISTSNSSKFEIEYFYIISAFSYTYCLPKFLHPIVESSKLYILFYCFADFKGILLILPGNLTLIQIIVIIVFHDLVHLSLCCLLSCCCCCFCCFCCFCCPAHSMFGSSTLVEPGNWCWHYLMSNFL